LCDIFLNGVSLDALVAEVGTSQNAIYKMLFGARRKVRGKFVANRYVELPHVYVTWWPPTSPRPSVITASPATLVACGPC
jgi:hypothetical protein